MALVRYLKNTIVYHDEHFVLLQLAHVHAHRLRDTIPFNKFIHVHGSLSKFKNGTDLTLLDLTLLDLKFVYQLLLCYLFIIIMFSFSATHSPQSIHCKLSNCDYLDSLSHMDYLASEYGIVTPPPKDVDLTPQERIIQKAMGDLLFLIDTHLKFWKPSGARKTLDGLHDAKLCVTGLLTAIRYVSTVHLFLW